MGHQPCQGDGYRKAPSRPRLHQLDLGDRQAIQAARDAIRNARPVPLK